jgi:hypothetical protein
MSTERCTNMNHGRPNVPVRHCPDCGVVVNKVLNMKCDHEKHATRRKDRSTFCSDCGTKLRP